MLSLKGPLLIAANHPNSFLDAIILSTLFKQPVYSLARGDAFTKPFYKKLLLSLNMFPVYRISEGVENLENNYDTFEKCKEVFKKNGIVLIFSEGRCINEWHLRPLKKGTARLAQSSWQEGIPLKVLPAGINYQSFTSFGKNLQLNFGNIIHEKDISSNDGYGKTINEFNEKLRSELSSLVIEIDSKDEQKKKEAFFIKQPVILLIILFIPALFGYILHAPLFIPVKKFALATGGHNDHYDSLLIGLLFILYPLYMLFAGLLVYWLTGGLWWLSVFIILPFCAKSYVLIKKQF
jgi:1-acyl-sn-glycerol-3-phosphate acyltransferase